MSGYKEFEGKTLDEAIRDACAYYDATRDKLEIDIINDAKSGIFGLVGARKARVRARLVKLASVLEDLNTLGGKEKSQKRRPDVSGADAGRNGDRSAQDSVLREPSQEIAPVGSPEVPFAGVGSAPADRVAHQSSGEKRGRGRSGGKPAKPPRQDRPRDENGRQPKQGIPRETTVAKQSPVASIEPLDIDADTEDFGRVPFDQLDIVELEKATREIISRITAPLLGEATIDVTISSDRVRISLTNVDDPGLLIGRDGQTLASLQYLVTRMLSNRMKALLRVQIDAGDYRERQDERLRELALSLAEKVKSGGRPQVTRPLSSYHRRVIHLTLQDDPLIQTHSKGEGEMKRVMVTRRKERP